MSGSIEEIADKIVYSSRECWACLFFEEPFCRYYHRHFDYDKDELLVKPEWCRVTRVIIELGG